MRRGSQTWGRVRFALSWALGIALVAVGLPKAVNVSWHGVVPVLVSLHWTALAGLAVLWALGLVVHSFVLTAAAPSLTHRRALTLNVTGSAIANVVPLGGAAGVELNRRMMRAWGIGGHSIAGYTFLTNLWDVAAKLSLPVVAAVVVARAGTTVGVVRLAAVVAGAAFVAVVAVGAMLLYSPRCTTALGRLIERVGHALLRAAGRDRDLHVTGALLAVRTECADIVAKGWVRMSVGILGYLALQCLMLWACLTLTRAGAAAPVVFAAFAVERMLSVVPLTPGAVGVADLGLVGVLLALSADPVGVTAGAVLYRVFIFALEIPVGGGTLALWLLGRRVRARRAAFGRRLVAEPRRIAHVTDVFLPRLGGIETHVDDLVRQQRRRGIDADVLTATRGGTAADPRWVHRIPLKAARARVGDYDLLHVHLSMLSPYSLSMARAASRSGVPVLITVHSMWVGASAVVRLAAAAGMGRWPVAWSAVSGAAAETFRRTLGGQDVAVLPNAVDVDAWRPSTETRDADAPLTLVSVMRLMPRKRPTQLVDIVARVRELAPDHDVRLRIVGDGPLRGRLERAIARRGLTPYVEITGRLPREQVLAQLHRASVYVAPAPKESFGIAVLEARCAGLPIVASRRSGVTDMVRDRREGLLVDGDDQMAVAIADLVVDDELRERITAHNRRVAPAFDWSDVLDRTEALYRVAVERAAAAAAEGELGTVGALGDLGDLAPVAEAPLAARA